MKLKKIYFDAFKSLLNKELEITHNCIGFVGINESGKSNVLRAIDVLSGNRKLFLSDTPKMARDKKPSLRFEFELNEDDSKKIKEAIKFWNEKYCIHDDSISIQNLSLVYNVCFNTITNLEERFFSLNGIKLADDLYFLLPIKSTDLYKIKSKETYQPINNALVIKERDLLADEKQWITYKSIEEINQKIASLEDEIKNSSESSIESPPLQEVSSAEIAALVNTSELPHQDSNSLVAELPSSKQNKQEILKELTEKKLNLESTIGDFNLPLILLDIKNKIAIDDSEISLIESEIKITETRLSELKKTPNTTPPEDDARKLEIQESTKTLAAIAARKQLLINDIASLQVTMETLREPLINKYTTDITVFNNYFQETFRYVTKDMLPKVAFWQHSKDYILQSQTLFSDILNKSTLNDISRPLLNVFRIGLGTNTIEELKIKIKEIQSIPNERSRLQKTLMNNVNEYIKSVWENYDQELNITLEQNQIRIEIFDPKSKSASYYNMEERSQGCQTFLSFLMTIGAEAMHGVIKNSILLLDEPETHLHPSGVKFMLKELLKIAENGNTVIFATHSIFMIDRENYDRHIILKKEKEQTQIKPANKGRIGFFMQEEVLYHALDINLAKDFDSTNLYNFVFEGDGDAVLFDHFYNKIIPSESHPFLQKNTRFYQGGKCSDIQDYFSRKPIQLLTKWVFILDSDSPANSLKKFIEGKYKEYLNKDVFVFQYENKKKKNTDIEFEDLLSESFIIETYEETGKLKGVALGQKELSKYITAESNFTNYDENILKKLVKTNIDDFKISFKESLNNKIKAATNTNTSEELFKKAFPEYYNWSTEILAKINDSTKKKEKA